MISFHNSLEEYQEVKKGTPVMLCGFPLGRSLFESDRVDSSFTVGTVRMVGRFLHHTAPSCSGNSGGPLLDREGRVIGVISFVRTAETSQLMNSCVPITQVRTLLEAKGP